MARSAPTPPAPPIEGGTYELKDGALVCIQQTAEPAAVDSPEPVIITEEPQDDATADT